MHRQKSAVLLLSAWCIACTGDEPRAAKAMTPAARADSAAAPRPAFSLAAASGGSSGRAYAANSQGATGSVAGTVKGVGPATDTTIVPTHDLRACSRFTEPLYPAKDGGVGDAIVWISGIASGRENDVPRRVTMTMEDCRLSPRVVPVAAGGTVILNSHDAISLRLRFLDTDARDSVRATVAMTDEGQVVPLSDATRTPGIVAVRDDLHPWVRGYLAVAPHPYVAVTEADGHFTFEGVPAGSYTLVVWHERFGLVSQPITITAGQGTKTDVQLR
jgi:hypothetical protein